MAGVVPPARPAHLSRGARGTLRGRGTCQPRLRGPTVLLPLSSVTNDVRLINKLWKCKQLCQREFNYWQYNMIVINTIRFPNCISKTKN